MSRFVQRILVAIGMTVFSAFQPASAAAEQMTRANTVPQQIPATASPAQLNLTQGQAAQIRAIDADTAKKLVSLRRAGLTSRDMHTKILQIRQDQQTSTAAVLTRDQQITYQAMLARAIRQRPTATPPTSPSTGSNTLAH